MKFRTQLFLGLFLLVLSALLYLLHYTVFHDSHHLFIYFLGDAAFVPIEVLLVSLILHRLLELRESVIKRKKRNVVIGVFFNELGSDLLKKIIAMDPNRSILDQRLCIQADWPNKNFRSAIDFVKEYLPNLNTVPSYLKNLNDLLAEKRSFLVRLLENDNLLEEEHFTDLLWSVFHVIDELEHRKDFSSLPEADYRHLQSDFHRVSTNLIIEWIEYMMHLKSYYPYLFSLALRTNPFNKSAAVEIP